MAIVGTNKKGLKNEYNNLNICIVIMDTGDHICESVQFNYSTREIMHLARKPSFPCIISKLIILHQRSTNSVLAVI